MSRSKPLVTEPDPHLHDNGSSRPSQKKKRASKPRDEEEEEAADHSSSDSITEHTQSPSIPSSPSMLWNAKPSVPVFVASLGNPKPYLSTLHSAGHIVLTCIAAQQKYNTWRPFAGGKIAEKNLTEFSYVTGYSMQGEALPTLWQSGALMNVSGKAVKRAWNEWKKQNGLEKGDASAAKLVIVHDELERELGAVSVRTDPKASARGHNGIKSVMAAFAGEPFVRIGVGIGRPESREKDAVSSYVLRKITPREGKALEQASLKVMQQIAEVSEGAIG